MTRSLRRRHRWMIRTLLLVLAVAAVLAFTRPAPSARVEALPTPIVTAEGSPNSR